MAYVPHSYDLPIDVAQEAVEREVEAKQRYTALAEATASTLGKADEAPTRRHFQIITDVLNEQSFTIQTSTHDGYGRNTRESQPIELTPAELDRLIAHLTAERERMVRRASLRGLA